MIGGFDRGAGVEVTGDIFEGHVRLVRERMKVVGGGGGADGEVLTVEDVLDSFEAGVPSGPRVGCSRRSLRGF
jgi:hypothetical protein